MDSLVDGMSVIVTGGSSGIGLETARLFLREGARVAICGRDEARLAAATEQLGGPSDRLIAGQCDVLIEDQVAAFVDRVRSGFGAVDVLVNNAGRGTIATFQETDDEAWRAEYELKLFSIIYPTRAALPLLEMSDHAAIVCVNALLARQPEPHMVATSSARAGVLSLAHSMASEFAAKGIRVNSILLGLVESEQWRRRHAEQALPGESFDDWSRALAASKQIPMGRLGKPEEAARAIFFLASPLSSYITGTALDVSGGVSRYA
jgi:NAD(P)-dependent dehydrogenase (short-subunit alcohol dehydrogenase family)